MSVVSEPFISNGCFSVCFFLWTNMPKCCDMYVSEYRQGLDWWMDLLTTYTHNSEVQAFKWYHRSPHFTNHCTLSLFQRAVSSLVVAWQQLSTVEILQLLCSHHYCPADITRLICQLDYSPISSQPSLQNSTELIALTVLIMTSQHGPHKKHHSSIVTCVLFATWKCVGY
jgi:hypothetical protein